MNDVTGSGANGAIIHYKPEPGSCSIVDAKSLFLLDSGAQYIDGTTDVTRTVHFGEPSARQKGCFSRVLQVPIVIDLACPCICSGSNLYLGERELWFLKAKSAFKS